jgi:CheY-like chemotaxis protein
LLFDDPRRIELPSQSFNMSMSNNIEPKQLPPKVVVAECYGAARASLADLLSYDGYRVLHADSLKTAISHIESLQNLDVVLVDLDMPDWEKIVRVAQATNALIVAMAGIHSVQNQDLKQRGIRVCLHKPIIYNDVLLAIKSHTAFSSPHA